MEFVLVAIVLAAVFGFIAYPILNPPRTEKTKSDALDTLLVQRDSAYQAIRDLDFDYQLGKLSETDYSALRERYKARAASALHELDTMQVAPTNRTGMAHEQDSNCGNCGTPYDPSDKFCRKCGNKLQ
jgi:hypothetical protein